MAQYRSISAALTAVLRAAEKAASDNTALHEVSQQTLTGLKARHGAYQPGWPRLQAATIARKGSDSPRLESGVHSLGSYRASVSGDRAAVGTDDPIELFQEYGTFRSGKPAIPPRPIFPHEARAAREYAPPIFVRALKRLFSAL